jgi:hypothetical protein
MTASRWLASILLIMPVAQLQGAQPRTSEKDSLEEVIVTTTTLKDLQQRIDRLEDAFYERFNALNAVRDFDTYCHEEARVGTRIARRYCRAVYVDNALEKEAQDYAVFLQRSSPSTGRGGKTPPVIGGPPVPALIEVEARKEAYRQNLRDVVGAHPELLELLVERSRLGDRYEALRRAASGATAASDAPR